jgi:23S rRNA pseudouridine1911/1915/1917 synthase
MKGVLTSMLRARHRKAGRARPTPLLEDFRKLGGRFENVGVGERLDKFLADHYKFHTRRVWQERVLGGEILVQHNAPRLSSPHPTGLVRVKHTYHLKVYDQIWLFHPAEDEPDSVDSLEIVSDDGDCVVFSKPGNLVIHAAGMYIRNTFVNAARKMGYGDAAPVHRIDRETSGLLLCARSYEARQELSAAFREGTMKKMYLAVCKGRVDVPERFRIDLPMGDAVESRIRLKLWVNGTNSSQASTYFSKLAQFEDYTLLACYPQTGRTNQIRVHLAFAGLWIVGDKMYHPQEDVFLEFYEKGLTPWVEEQLCFPRHLLHNAGIKGPETLKSSVGHSAVFCPFTPDMLSFQPLIELMKNAHLPQEIEAQKEKLREFFEEDSEADFLAAPTLNDAAQFVLGS